MLVGQAAQQAQWRGCVHDGHAQPLPVIQSLLRACNAVTTGYECEPYNNPADFFLDIINGDSTAVAMSKIDETNTGTKPRAE